MLAVVAAVIPYPAAARTFQELIGEQTILAPVGEAFADTIGQALPIAAASAGVTFTFDKETHAFERATDIFGQLYLERPRTIGRGRWNVHLDYAWIKIDDVGGQDLDDLADNGPPILDPPSGALFTLPRFDMSLQVDQITTSVTYGITDDLDVNLAVPILASTFEIDAVARVVGSPRTQVDRQRSSKTGVGDLRLRAKYRLLRRGWGELGTGLTLRFPTGNEENFQGSGSFQVGPALYAATREYSVHPAVRLQGYANLGLDFATADVGRSDGRYGIGVDCAIAERLTLAAAFVAREPFQGIADAGAFDVVRVDPQTGRRVVAPVLGLSTGRASAYDLSFGGRVALWRGTVFGFANVLVQLNEGGLRTNAIPVVGLEAAF